MWEKEWHKKCELKVEWTTLHLIACSLSHEKEITDRFALPYAQDDIIYLRCPRAALASHTSRPFPLLPRSSESSRWVAMHGRRFMSRIPRSTGASLLRPGDDSAIFGDYSTPFDYRTGGTRLDDYRILYEGACHTPFRAYRIPIWDFRGTIHSLSGDHCIIARGCRTIIGSSPSEGKKSRLQETSRRTGQLGRLSELSARPGEQIIAQP